MAGQKIIMDIIFNLTFGGRYFVPSLILTPPPMRSDFTLCLFVLAFAGLTAQTIPGFMAGTYKNSGDIFGTRVFVENRGQFDNKAADGEHIYYALDNGLEKIYFTSLGLVYEQIKTPPFSKRDIERFERDPHYKLPPTEHFYVTMRWQNANKNIVIEKYEPQTHYISYGDAHLQSRTFKRLVYKNVYNKIDIEYTIPSDKSYGIKYNLILHPGADPSRISLLYSGDVKKIRRQENGDVIIETSVDPIIEHAPLSFYSQGEELASAFDVNKNELGFVFPEGFNRKRTIVIDPWVTSISSLTSNQYAYDVDYDFAGNTYIYGGYSSYKVARYNSTGTLQWTFAGAVPSQTWTSDPIVSQASNFAVNKYNSKCYIGQGFVNSGNRVIRIDAFGNYDNFINTANNQFQEVWDMGFHCTNDGDVFVLGGGTSSNISAVTINPTTAVITLATFQPTNTGIAQDVASHAIDDAGKIFVLYAGAAGLNNKMSLVNAGFNNNVWTQPSTYNTFNEQGNKNSYVGAGSLSSNGFNALAVNGNYLFYYDGFNLAAYDKTTGAQLVATTISGQTVEQQGGIAVDDCNNLYLGGNGSILSYNFNGTTFTALTSLTLGAASTNKYVYDIKLDKAGKLLYVCGSGFVGVYSPANSLSCPTASSICFSYQLLDHVICAGSSVTLSAVGSTTLANAGYTLQPNNISNTTGSFVLTPTATAAYTIYLSGTNSSNAVITSSAVSNVSVFPNPQVAPTVTQATCVDPSNGFDLNLSWNPPGANPTYTITWSQLPDGISSPQQTSVNGTISPGVYQATVSTEWGCAAYASFTINGTPEPSVFSLVPNKPYVLTCYNPVLTFSFNPPSYNYTTSNAITAAQNGPNPSITFTNSQGIYTVIGEHPVTGCISTHTFAVTHNTSVPVSAISPTFQNITCSLSSIQTITASVSPTINISHEWISPQNTTLTANSPTAYFVPGGPGPFKHCVVDIGNGCRTCKNFTVTSSDGFPTFTVNSAPANFTLGCSTKSIISINIVDANTTPTPGGAVSFTVLPPGSTVTLPGGLLSPVKVYPVSVPGNYTIVTRDNSNTCDTKVYLSVLTNTNPPLIDTLRVPREVLTCDQPSVVIEGISSSPNISVKWDLPNNQAVQQASLAVNSISGSPNASVVGTYTFHVTDNNNLCINTSSVRILQNIIPPVAAFSGLDEITCTTHTVLLSNNSSSQVLPYFNPSKIVQAWMWMGPSPQLPLQASSSYVAYMPGTYTLIAKDLSNGCFATATKDIADNRDFPLVNRPSAPDPLVLDCGAVSRKIGANIQSISPSFTYSWVAAPGATVSGTGNDSLTVFQTGRYEIFVLNKDNGCLSHGFVDVIDGAIDADFEASSYTGYAPLAVNFTNTSSSTLDTNNIQSVWSFGNGTSTLSLQAGVVPQVVYDQAGTYKVTMYAGKGTCIDTVIKYIEVELPSRLEIPNIFTPNGDGINDVYFLETSNIDKIEMSIYDRWGKLVYYLNTDKGNVAWDGRNQQGRVVPDGVYMYTLKANGKDGTEYDRQGNITVAR